MTSAYGFSYMLEDVGLAFLPGLISGVPSFAFGLAAYVLTAMSLYTMATRRGISYAWLSWVPVLNVWIIGSLSDQYRYVVKGQYKSKRKILLILNLINAAVALILMIVAVGVTVELTTGAIYGVRGNELWNSVLGSALGATGLALTMGGISIAAAVIRYMALYDIYVSMDPANSVLFLVLSIIFNVTEAFFLFFNRNKDRGMPPRREAPAQEPWEQDNKDYV
jgi:hypothetical protein